jgi:hypothetical protein
LRKNGWGNRLLNISGSSEAYYIILGTIYRTCTGDKETSTISALKVGQNILAAVLQYKLYQVTGTQ